MEVAVIIKALNEEKNIGRSIKSALKAVRNLKGEVILADSLSSDKTINIAKKYPIKIFQIINANNRSCGIGPQIGYLKSNSKYLYILDGDMEIDENFIRIGIKELESDKELAGIGGIIEEMTDANLIFRRRKTHNRSKIKNAKYVDNLMMGGLYRKSAIDNAGYFSNQFLHSYEESDLGVRLRTLGYELKRIPVNMAKHYGDEGSSIAITMSRFKSKYLWGAGEFLRYHLWKPTLFGVVWELKIYLSVLLWWAVLIVLYMTRPFSHYFVKMQLFFTII